MLLGRTRGGSLRVRWQSFSRRTSHVLLVIPVAAVPILLVVYTILALCNLSLALPSLTVAFVSTRRARSSRAEAAAVFHPALRGRAQFPRLARPQASAGALRAADASSVPGLWKAGPAEIYTGAAQKCMYLLKENPMLFDASVEAELEALSLQKKEERARKGGLEKTTKQDTLVLRQRMEEVRRNERANVATELLYLKVCSQFQKLKVPLIPQFKGGGDIKLGSVDLKGLTTEIYSEDALELVREHLFSIIGSTSMIESLAVVQIALIQASQVYAMSSFFGYYLRRMDARYQLEKLAGTFGAWGDEPISGSTGAPFTEEEMESVSSLKDYINTFGPKEMMKIGSIASKEAQAAMERQVTALFGDLRVLKQQLQDALGAVSSPEEAHAKLHEAMQNGEVESVHISSEDVRRMVLEAVAFGALLSDQEKQAEMFYELTPRDDRLPDTIMGDDEGGDGRILGE